MSKRTRTGILTTIIVAIVMFFVTITAIVFNRAVDYYQHLINYQVARRYEINQVEILITQGRLGATSLTLLTYLYCEDERGTLIAAEIEYLDAILDEISIRIQTLRYSLYSDTQIADDDREFFYLELSRIENYIYYLFTDYLVAIYCYALEVNIAGISQLKQQSYPHIEAIISSLHYARDRITEALQLDGERALLASTFAITTTVAVSILTVILIIFITTFFFRSSAKSIDIALSINKQYEEEKRLRALRDNQFAE